MYVVVHDPYFPWYQWWPNECSMNDNYTAPSSVTQQEKIFCSDWLHQKQHLPYASSLLPMTHGWVTTENGHFGCTCTHLGWISPRGVVTGDIENIMSSRHPDSKWCPLYFLWQISAAVVHKPAHSRTEGLEFCDSCHNCHLPGIHQWVWDQKQILLWSPPSLSHM